MQTALVFAAFLIPLLAGCATPITQAQIQQAVANANTLTAATCTLVQPGLSVGAAASGNADAQLASTANAAFCAGVTAAAAKASVPSVPNSASAAGGK